MTEKELFDLCKQVYQRTKWIGTTSRSQGNDLVDLWFNSSAGWVVEREVLASALEDKPDDWIPLYSSDYISRMIPPKIGDYRLQLNNFGKVIGWSCGYVDDEGHYCYELSSSSQKTEIGEAHKTLLMSLLKLVIALDDAGELNEKI